MNGACLDVTPLVKSRRNIFCIYNISIPADILKKGNRVLKDKFGHNRARQGLGGDARFE